jgi:radical SAM protein with 4Fe4S-binding SPASM domain
VKDLFNFEHGYFRLSGNPVKYFLSQGNVVAHITDRIKFRLFPKIYVVAGFPTHLDIEASSVCQMRCPMCYTSYMDSSFKGIMKYDLYKKIIDQAVSEGVYSVKLSWRGEPLLNPRIVDIVRYAKKSGIKEVAFLSNGERLSNNISEQLVDAGLDWISFSIDGMDEVYNSIRVPAIFRESVEKVKYLRSYRDKKKQIKPLIRVQSILSAIKNNAEEYKKVWEGIADRVNFIADEARDFDLKNMAHDPAYVCPTPWQRMSIAFDGKVHQCITDYAGKWILGNTNVQSLSEIWHGASFEALRKHFRKHSALDNCEACHYCSDNVPTEARTIKVGNKLIKVSKYKGIADVIDETEKIQRTPITRLTSESKKENKE